MNHHAIATEAMQAIMLTLALGQDKHGDAWQTRDDREDIKHINAHLGCYLMGDCSEPHLDHALTRIAS